MPPSPPSPPPKEWLLYDADVNQQGEFCIQADPSLFTTVEDSYIGVYCKPEIRRETLDEALAAVAQTSGCNGVTHENGCSDPHGCYTGRAQTYTTPSSGETSWKLTDKKNGAYDCSFPNDGVPPVGGESELICLNSCAKKGYTFAQYDVGDHSMSRCCGCSNSCDSTAVASDRTYRLYRFGYESPPPPWSPPPPSLPSPPSPPLPPAPPPPPCAKLEVGICPETLAHVCISGSPASVKKQGYKQCTTLGGVTIPDSVTSIGAVNAALTRPPPVLALASLALTCSLALALAATPIVPSTNARASRA